VETGAPPTSAISISKNGVPCSVIRQPPATCTRPVEVFSSETWSRAPASIAAAIEPHVILARPVAASLDLRPSRPRSRAFAGERPSCRLTLRSPRREGGNAPLDIQSSSRYSNSTYPLSDPRQQLAGRIRQSQVTLSRVRPSTVHGPSELVQAPADSAET